MIIVLAGAMGSGKDTIGDLLVKNHGFTKTSFAEPLKQMAKLAFPAFTDESLYGSSSARETQFIQYPFSGTCLHCGRDCCDAEDMGPGEQHWPEQYRYHCEICDLNYTTSVSPRMALQTLGTEWGRRLYPNVWVDAAFVRLKVARWKWKERMFPAAYGMAHPNFPMEPEPNFVITDCRFKNEVEGSKKNGGIVVRLTRRMDAATTSHASEAELKTIPLNQFDYVFDNTLYGLEQLPEQVEIMLELLKKRDPARTM